MNWRYADTAGVFVSNYFINDQPLKPVNVHWPHSNRICSLLCQCTHVIDMDLNLLLDWRLRARLPVLRWLAVPLGIPWSELTTDWLPYHWPMLEHCWLVKITLGQRGKKSWKNVRTTFRREKQNRQHLWNNVHLLHGKEGERSWQYPAMN